MPPIQGTYESKLLASQQNHPLQVILGAMGVIYELPKKRRVPNPSPYDASSPHRREQDQGDGRNTYESSPSRQNVAGVRQPRKRRVPKSLPRSRIHPSEEGWANVRPATDLPQSVEEHI